MFWKTSARVEQLEPRVMVMLPTAVDRKKVEYLRARMTVHGWVGRPLLVLDAHNTYYALTGASRIAAVRQTEIAEIPAIIIDSDDFHCAIEMGYFVAAMLADDTDDLDRLGVIESHRLHDDICNLMAVEIAYEEVGGPT